jgi:hypothetical protein
MQSGQLVRMTGQLINALTGRVCGKARLAITIAVMSGLALRSWRPAPINP